MTTSANGGATPAPSQPASLPSRPLQSVRTCALFLPEIKQLLAQKDYGTLKAVLRELNPIDLAEGWREFAPEERLAVFQMLGTRRAVVVFEELDVEDQTFLLQALGEQATGQIISELPAGEVAHLFRKLPHRVIRRLAHLVKQQETIERLQQTLTYPPRTAGSLMHTEAVRVKESMTAGQALDLLQTVTRAHVHQERLLSTMYVTNGRGRLVGHVSLQRLVASPRDSLIKELMESTAPIQIEATADQEVAAQVVTKYNLVSAPVVDAEDRLLGVLLVDDIIDIIRQEANEDIAKMVGTRPEEFVRKSVLQVAWLRLPWLLASILGGAMVSLVIHHFEVTLVKVVALASFMPLIAAMGGNVGAQSATIIVRSMATGQVRMVDWAKAMAHEFAVGILLGVSYGTCVGGLAYLMYGSEFGVFFAVVVSMGMLISMTVAATIGAVEPFIFQRLGIDPATATGPLITTATDLIATSAYLALATAILV